MGFSWLEFLHNDAIKLTLLMVLSCYTDAATRSSIHSAYSAAGINILASAFGSTENPTTSGFDPTGTANTMATWIKTYGLDGIDVDYEDL